jgi:protein-tyrosine phosphatase
MGISWIFNYINPFHDNSGPVTDKIFRGPLPKDYKKLANKGVTAIINLYDKSSVKERLKASAAGIDVYFHIPMKDDEAPLDSQADEFLSAIDNNQREVIYVHCKGGRHRTGIMIALFRIERCAWTLEEAVEEMKKYQWYGEMGHQKLLDWLTDRYNRRTNG